MPEACLWDQMSIWQAQQKGAMDTRAQIWLRCAVKPPCGPSAVPCSMHPMGSLMSSSNATTQVFSSLQAGCIARKAFARAWSLLHNSWTKEKYKCI